jgi:hypothetical protein
MRFVDGTKEPTVKVNGEIDEDGNFVILVDNIPIAYLDHINGRLMLIRISSYNSKEYLEKLGIDFSTDYISISVL